MRLLLLLLLCTITCVPISEKLINIEKDYFPLIDKQSNLHKYDSLISIDINESITKYCSKHYEWEVISLRYMVRLDDPIGVHFNSTEYIVRKLN